MENPIKELLVTNSVLVVAKQVKLNPNTVRQISRMTINDIGGVKMGTAMQIYEELGIDLWGYFMSIRQENKKLNS